MTDAKRNIFQIASGILVVLAVSGTSWSMPERHPESPDGTKGNIYAASPANSHPPRNPVHIVQASGTGNGAGAADTDPGSGGKVSRMTEERVRAIVRDWIKKNPEIVVQSLERLRRRLRRQSTGPAPDRAIRRAKNPDFGAASVIAGNANDPVTVVEFIDPNCPWCRKTVHEVESLIRRRDDVRVIVRTIPVLGEDSKGAAHVGRALAAQGLYREWLRELGELSVSSRTIDAAAARDIAAAIGADMNELRSRATDPEVSANIQRNINLAKKLNMRGTPSFIIADQVARGALDAEALSKKIEKALHAEAGGNGSNETGSTGAEDAAASPAAKGGDADGGPRFGPGNDDGADTDGSARKDDTATNPKKTSEKE